MLRAVHDRGRLGADAEHRRAGQYLGIPVRTIYDWRLSGRGPRAVHVGRALRYRVCDVQAWLDAQLERVPGEPGSGEPG